MAYAKRKDSRGQTLNVGECQRKDGRYSFSWTNSRGTRKSIYAKSLLELRKREKALKERLADGVEPDDFDKITVNQIWDKYISQKRNLKETTKSNYVYTYDHFVRDTFGNSKVSKVRYTNVKEFYTELLEEKEIAVSTLDNINTNLHPAFQMAVRDGFIHTNPTEGVMNEIKKDNAGWKKKRHALTVPQEKAFVEFIDDHPIYEGWYPILITMLGTGMRVGEAIGLRWKDIDFKKNEISVNHNLIYRPIEGKSKLLITTTKTAAGNRTIPLFPEVYDALLREYQVQKVTGGNKSVIDGYYGFIFTNKEGNVHRPNDINKAIKRIIEDYNMQEAKKSKVEGRDPIYLPHFSNHNLRHTFCTRLCENESNIKVIQSIMGHSDIQTTLDIYAECTPEKKQEVLVNLAGKILGK